MNLFEQQEAVPVGRLLHFRGKRTLPIANDNINAADTEAALSGFVIALARHQARIDHAHAMGAADDNTRH
jgi:hypothetical protein